MNFSLVPLSVPIQKLVTRNLLCSVRIAIHVLISGKKPVCRLEWKE